MAIYQSLKLPLRLFLLVIFTLYLTSCANVVKPIGGEVDETSPQLISAQPPNYTTGFKNRQIRIEFDKFVELNSPFENIFVSPPLSPTPKYEARRKEIIINLNPDSLLENTTYTIYFGNAVRDIREGNIQSDLKYVFSTGNFIDSLIVEGFVTNAATSVVKEGMRVMLHKDLSDSAVFKTKPMYIGRTDATGFYRIENIKYGTYRAYALKDENNNFLYDNREEFAFIDTALSLTDTVTYLNFNSFVHNRTKPNLINSRVLKEGKVRFAFNRDITNFKIEPLEPDNRLHKKEFFYKSFNDKKDTVTIWQSPPYIDSLIYLISFNDSLNDTLVFDMSVSATGRETIKDSLLIFSTNVKAGERLNLGKSFECIFDDPIVSVNKDLISIIRDSTENIKNINIDFINEAKTKISIDFPQESQMFYEIMFLPGTFTDLYRNTNDTVYIPFNTQREEAYGLIHFKVDLSLDIATPVILQLLDRNYEPVTQKILEHSGEVSFPYLLPQTYKARIVIDEDNNTKWTGGNFLKGIQPEKVYLYPEDINLRANWEMRDLVFVVE